MPPSRVLDTRTTAGGARPLPVGQTLLGLRLPRFGNPATAVLATVTVVSPATAGWVRLGGPDGTSSVTYAAGETTSNTVLAWMDGSPSEQLPVTVFGAPVHVVVDVTAVVDDGYSPSGVVAVPLPGGPVRIADSRRGLGIGTLPGGAARSLPVSSSLRDQDTWGVLQNVTAIPTRPTWLVAYPSGTPRPGTSSLLAAPPSPCAATVLTGLSAGGSEDLYSLAGPTDVVSDVSARVQLFPSTAQLGGFARIPETLAAVPPATRSR
ncbi:hypothetical protein [Lapillicoccus jejuensis]|uniref:Uncharacterized protein n=1 Tax=Lapillicoccus jejuensis TaxID=402171 RepID=A0A542DX02_9MICO|nr:hypothetical protein [Lapillicoccus jejuensis]TQJ07617.1 hypothetical protein FB458_0685 [Lapillicoccus jejuensis]